MNALSDQQLLQDYVENRSEPAFTELVRRHVDLVYSAALRRVRDAHQAQDVTQGTFVALAQNAGQLRHHPVLSGWLHRTTHNIAANLVRSNARRQVREQEAVTMNELLTSTRDADWEAISPHLDAALDELEAADRDAVMLRYFEKKSAGEMAVQLGISDDAAQKRVSRAVERLRELFAKRGVTVGTSGLAVIISANSVQAAPIGLALTISTAAALTGTTLTTTATVAATKAIAMTTLQKALVTATIAVLTGFGIYEAHQATQLRDRVQSLQQLQADQAEQRQKQLDAANKLVLGLTEELAGAKTNNAELLKLRGDVGVLRKQVQEARQTQAKAEQTPKVYDIPADAAEQQKRMQLGKMTDGRNFSAQLISFADKNQGWLPTDWRQVDEFADKFPVSGTNEFEFVHNQPINLRELGTNFDNTLVVREYLAWKTHDGKWRKVYGYADGHSQVVEVADGNFAAWEAQNTYNPAGATK